MTGQLDEHTHLALKGTRAKVLYYLSFKLSIKSLGETFGKVIFLPISENIRFLKNDYLHKFAYPPHMLNGISVPKVYIAGQIYSLDFATS